MKTLPSIATVIMVFCLSAPLLAYGRSPLQARKDLIQLNIPYNVDAFTHSATQGDNVAVQLFLEAGMDVNAEDRNGITALARAAEQGHINTMQILLHAGADKHVALGRAAQAGTARSVQVLLEAGVNRQATTAALCLAAGRGHIAIVQTLLAAGADVQASTKGRTALMDAAKNGHVSVVSALLAAGADVQASTKGWTALMDAAKNGHVSVVQALLAAGANVHAKNEYGWQALMYASWKGHALVVQALLGGGADVQAQTNAGDNALTLASVQEHPEVIRLLKKAGAQWNPGVRRPEIREPKTPYLQYLEKSDETAQEFKSLMRQMGLDIDTRQPIRAEDVLEKKTAAELSPPRIRQAQEYLKAQGFDPGLIDGLLGLRTTEALRQYQAKHKLPVTGKLDETTLKTLDVQ